MIVNKTELGKIFGVGNSTTDRWIANGCPATKKGKSWSLDTVKVFQWKLYDVGLKLDINQERAALAQKQRQKIELDMAERQRELIPAGEILKIWARKITSARARLLSLPSKAAPHLAATNDQAEAEQIINDYVMEALHELES